MHLWWLITSAPEAVSPGALKVVDKGARRGSVHKIFGQLVMWLTNPEKGFYRSLLFLLFTNCFNIVVHIILIVRLPIAELQPMKRSH